MNKIENQKFDEERALYKINGIILENCTFDGVADGESAVKESTDIEVYNCFFNLRYPFWHDSNLKISDSIMTEFCRASLWYSEHIEIKNTKLHGIKALRECTDVLIKESDIVSPEFGWSVTGITMENCTAESEYFMLRSRDIHFKNVHFKGKYSFQYIKNAVFENCVFDTKDAFWHGKNIVVRNSNIKGEYLAWYSDSLTLENCKIIGTQPFCWCSNLKLINCEMINTDLSFEKSEVQADIITHIESIKNPLIGKITAPSVGEIIINDENAKGEVIISN
ncbi:MAG: DUF3737 family protein [Ruminococcus sp.]|nr:DUF3737 family protein [Ruminococcus sp.]